MGSEPKPARPAADKEPGATDKKPGAADEDPGPPGTAAAARISAARFLNLRPWCGRLRLGRLEAEGEGERELGIVLSMRKSDVEK